MKVIDVEWERISDEKWRLASKTTDVCIGHVFGKPHGLWWPSCANTTYQTRELAMAAVEAHHGVRRVEG